MRKSMGGTSLKITRPQKPKRHRRWRSAYGPGFIRPTPLAYFTLGKLEHERREQSDDLLDTSAGQILGGLIVLNAILSPDSMPVSSNND